MKTKFKGFLTLLLAFVVQITFAQEKTVSGTVVDESNMPLPTATVLIKGTSTGTSTDFDGKYSIQAKQGDVLEFSFVGYATQSVTVGSSNSINVNMAPDAAALDAVVVTALGIKRKQSEITSAFQNVKGDEIRAAGNPNSVAALTGKVSGLRITQTNSSVNGSNRVLLRGASSISGDNGAMVVIDGAISSMAVFQALPPEIIASTNVLKGPQGAALYGQEGGNGVIVVTTVGGAEKDSKLTVQFSSNIDFEEIAFVPERQTKYGQGWSGDHVTYENGGWGPAFDGTLQPVGLAQADGSYLTAPYSPIEDNIKQFFDAGTTYQNTGIISAADADSDILLSLKQLDREFVVANDRSKTTTAFIKANKRMGKWNFGVNATYYTRKTGVTSSGLFTQLLQTATNIPVDQFSGGLNQHHWTSYYRSPYWTRDNVRNNSQTGFFSGVVNLGYKINDNIDVLYRGNIRSINGQSDSHTNEYIDVLNVGGGDHTINSAFDTSNSSSRTYQGDLMANLKYSLTEKIGLKSNVGLFSRDFKSTSTSLGGDNLTIPGLYNASNVTGTPRIANSTFTNRRFSVYAGLDLNYEDYLFLQFTARNDWDSRLAPENNSFFYPSAGISFIPTKAIASLKNNKTLNSAKVYANYSAVGRTNVGTYAVNNPFTSVGGYPFGGLNTFVPNTGVTDPLLQNEDVKNIEGGVNLGFFKDRLTLDAAYFVLETSNADNFLDTSYASGAAGARINSSTTETTGFEIDLGFTPIDNKKIGLKWTNRLSIFADKTIVKDLGGVDEISLQSFSRVAIVAEVGEQFPMIKGTGYQRDPQGRVLIDPNTGNPLKTDSFINLGINNPDYTLGYNTSVTFKGIRLSATMDYRTGENYKFWAGNKDWLSWSGHLVESAENGRRGFIFPNSAIETSPGVYAANTGVITGGTTYNSYLNYFSNEYRDVTENFVLDATAFKVREIALSYTLTEKNLKGTGLEQVRFGVNARNPFIVLPTENRNYHDPENSNTTGNGSGLAVTGQYPTTRTFGFNLNVIF